jgi:hypothetical protein
VQGNNLNPLVSATSLALVDLMQYSCQTLPSRDSLFSHFSSDWPHAAAFLMGEFGCRVIGSLDAFDLFDTTCAVRPQAFLDSASVETVSVLVRELLFRKPANAVA